jgi:hypothetical protein
MSIEITLDSKPSYLNVIDPINELKAEAVPLHSTKALGGRGDIAPTLSRPRH